MEQIQRKSMLYRTKVEYSVLSANYVEGCVHGCLIPCFARLIKHKKYDAWIQPKLVANTLDLLEKEMPKFPERSEVFLCFATDPFMIGYPEVTELTIQVIQKLRENGFPVRILTKGILPYDLRTLKGCSVGYSIGTLEDWRRSEFEPRSVSIFRRVRELHQTFDFGISTWVSIEPFYLDSTPVEEILEAVPFVERAVFGRWNYAGIKRDEEYRESARRFLKKCEEMEIEGIVKKEVGL